MMTFRKEDEFRKWHWLRPNETTSTPRQLIFVDTETVAVGGTAGTNRESHRLRCWCASACRFERGQVTRRKESFGFEAWQLWDFVRQYMATKTPAYLFAHNLGFDLTILDFWRKLDAGDFVLKDGTAPVTTRGGKRREEVWQGFVCVQDPPTIVEVRQQGTTRTLIALDTMNYFRAPLEELGRVIGRPKLALPAAGSADEEWLRYCRNDCAIVEETVLSLLRFIREHDLGQFRYTVSAMALQAYRHRFMPKRSILIHGHRPSIELERASFYGGLVRCFRLGTYNDVYPLDVQSFYPSIMREHSFPCRLIACEENDAISRWTAFRDECALVAEVKLRTPRQAFPLRRDGVVTLARGNFTTTLAGPELDRAYGFGVVEKCLRFAAFESKPLFREYVDFFWQIRQDFHEHQMPAWEDFAKLFGVSLFGKFVQKALRWQEDGDVYAPHPWGHFHRVNGDTGEVETFRALSWLVQRHTAGGEADHSFPAIGAYVTSLGRVIMQAYVSVAGESECYYMDTDSLHVTGLGYRRLKAAGHVKLGQLGKFKVGPRIKTATYRGVKNYTLDGVHTIAGVKRGSKEVEPLVFEQNEFSSLAAVLHGDTTPRVTISRRLIPIAGKDAALKTDAAGRVEVPLVEEW